MFIINYEAAGSQLKTKYALNTPYLLSGIKVNQSRRDILPSGRILVNGLLLSVE